MKYIPRLLKVKKAARATVESKSRSTVKKLLEAEGFHVTVGARGVMVVTPKPAVQGVHHVYAGKGRSGAIVIRERQYGFDAVKTTEETPKPKAPRFHKGSRTTKAFAEEVLAEAWRLEQLGLYDEQEFVQALVAKLPGGSLLLNKTAETQAEEQAGYKPLSADPVVVQRASDMPTEKVIQELAQSLKGTSGIVDTLIQRVTVGWDDKANTSYVILAFTDPEDLDAGEEAYGLWRAYLNDDTNPHVGLDFVTHEPGIIDSYLDEGCTVVANA